MKRSVQAQPKREGLRFLKTTKLSGMKIFSGSQLAIKGDVVGEYKIERAGGEMRKLATVVETKIPPAEINSWGLNVALAPSVEDALGRSAVTLLARVYQVIKLGKRGPGRFGGGKVNLHFVKYKREKFVLYWWTIKKRLYLGACLPVLSPFVFTCNENDVVHSR